MIDREPKDYPVFFEDDIFDPVVEKDIGEIGQHEPGAKLDTGKVRMGLMLDFSRALKAVGELATAGANKYTDGGWKSVPNAEARYKDALFRHFIEHEEYTDDMAEYNNGKEILHDVAVAWNALAYLEKKLERIEQEEDNFFQQGEDPAKPLTFKRIVEWWKDGR